MRKGQLLQYDIGEKAKRHAAGSAPRLARGANSAHPARGSGQYLDGQPLHPWSPFAGVRFQVQVGLAPVEIAQTRFAAFWLRRPLFVELSDRAAGGLEGRLQLGRGI